MRNGNICWIGGAKEGIGKRMVATAMVELWVERSASPLVVDCCASEDELKRYRAEAEVHRTNLDTGSGWMTLFDLCERNRKRPIVVRAGTPRCGAGPRFGRAVDAIADELGRRLVALWIIDRGEASLEALKSFMTAMPATALHVVCNGYFGELETFDEYHHSRLRGAIEGNGGKTVWLPRLGEAAVLALKHGRAPKNPAAPSEADGEVDRWLAETKRALEPLVAEL